mgnify:CR=1 FL=1
MGTKICIQEKDGKPAYHEVSTEELAAMQPVQLTWHKEIKPFRVTVSNETWRDWFQKKRDHLDYFELTGQELYPDLLGLLEIVKTIDNSNIINDEQNTYVYLDEVYNEHLAIINKYGGNVEQMPEW